MGGPNPIFGNIRTETLSKHQSFIRVVSAQQNFDAFDNAHRHLEVVEADENVINQPDEQNDDSSASQGDPS